MRSRNKKFGEIEQLYNEFYAGIMKSGRMPIRRTKKGLWGTTPCEALFGLFKRLHLERCKSFLDLGSGDGKAVLIASLFTKATGIEYDHELAMRSREFAKKLGIKARFIEGDYFRRSISSYDFVFINPDNEFSHGLDDKLLKELRGKLACFSLVYAPNRLKKGKTYWLGQMPFTVYTIPE